MKSGDFPATFIEMRYAVFTMTVHDKFNSRKLKHTLKHILYPVRTADLREIMRTEGKGDSIVDLMNKLPLKTWKNASEIFDHLKPIMDKKIERQLVKKHGH